MGALDSWFLALPSWFEVFLLSTLRYHELGLVASINLSTLSDGLD